MVKTIPYIPERGDIVWVDFNPQKGHEQAHRRPAIILSPKFYNEKARLALMCPITTQIKGYPFEIGLDAGKITGAILSDQIRSLDWHSRNAVFILKIKAEILTQVQKRITQLITE